jgi:hypothetical protein
MTAVRMLITCCSLAVVVLGCNSNSSGKTSMSMLPNCKGAPSSGSACALTVFCEEPDGTILNISSLSAGDTGTQSETCNPPTACMGDDMELSCVGMSPDSALMCVQLPVKSDAGVGSYCCPCQQP